MHLALLDEPRSGAENMAVDQAMLDAASQRGCCLLRLYTWSEPTLSLGYFQRYADRATHPPSELLPVVRRKTGGGAIVHHHDWTYSIAVPEQLMRARLRHSPSAQLGAAQPLYEAIHQAVVEWLQTQQVIAAAWSSQAACVSEPSSDSTCSFLCFERRATGDVVAGDHKLMGSAQRRQRGALLQHGSLLLSQSDYAPSLPGLRQVAAPNGPSSQASTKSPDRRVFFERLRESAESLLAISLRTVSSLPSMLDLPIDAESFQDDSWTRKR